MMFFVFPGTSTRVMSDARALYRHRYEQEHAVGQAVYRDGHRCTRACTLFRSKCEAFLGRTQGPAPRPAAYVSLSGTEVDADGNATGRTLTFYAGDVEPACLYRAVIGDEVRMLWGATGAAAVSAAGWPSVTVNTDGEIHSDGIRIGSLALVG
jgi:hypothetical protein